MSTQSSSPKRNLKESKIIDAAEHVFSEVGYSNAKMEAVAKKVGVSKGTVYFYFDTKENLYMAVTYRALQTLNEYLYRSLERDRDKKGLEKVMGLVETYMDFCDKYFLYSEVILDYMTLNRSTKFGRDRAKLTDALKESMYYRRVRDIQNLPISLITQEIRNGVKDGSIRNREQPEMLYLTAWSSVIGFVKLNVAAGSNRQTLLNVDIRQWKNYIFKILRRTLLSER